MSYYTIKKIRPSIYTINDPLGVYCYFVAGKEKGLLFDTGHGIAPLKPVISQFFDKPYEVVLSHGHWDHTAGAYEHEQVWLHPEDKELFNRHLSRDIREIIAGMYEELLINNQPDDANVLNPYLVETFNRDEYLQLENDVDIKDLEYFQTFDLGGIHAQIIDMKGHTPGSVGLLIKEEKLLLTGDAANAHCWMFLEDSLPISRYIEMLKKVNELDFETFLASHADDIFPKADIEKYMNVAQKIDMSKAKPYGYKFEQLGGYLFEENGVGIVFDPRRL